MRPILLICDDEVRRAELHRLLLTEFEVYSASHRTAKSIRKKIKNKSVIVVEEEGLGTEKKISIHPVTEKWDKRLGRLIKSILGEKI